MTYKNGIVKQVKMETNLDIKSFLMDNSTFLDSEELLLNVEDDFSGDQLIPSRQNFSSFLEAVREANASEIKVFRTEAITTELTTEFNECTDIIYKYLTFILGSLLGCTLVVLVILLLFIWKQFYRRSGGKKVSRAESWRYESSIYINPARHKGGVPIYVPSPTLPLTQPLALHSPGDQEISIDTFQHRISRSFNAEIIPEEASNFNTIERLSNEASTRAASPQQTPLLYRRDSQLGTPIGTPQVSPHLHRARHNSSNTGLNIRHTSSSNQGLNARTGSVTGATSPGWGNPTGSRHQRNNSLSSALRGVDIIRCTTPCTTSRATPSPTPPQQMGQYTSNNCRTQPSPTIHPRGNHRNGGGFIELQAEDSSDDLVND